ncbi:hypothetical protein Tco_1053161 [Tanacetum coccineum]
MVGFGFIQYDELNIKDVYFGGGVVVGEEFSAKGGGGDELVLEEIDDDDDKVPLVEGVLMGAFGGVGDLGLLEGGEVIISSSLVKGLRGCHGRVEVEEDEMV